LIKELTLAIERDLRFIVYLYRKIEETSIKPMNDAMIDYIQTCINTINKNDEKFSEQKKQKLISGFNDITQRLKFL
jgi:hypothetical protein